jgi:hypothetical protein
MKLEKPMLNVPKGLITLFFLGDKQDILRSSVNEGLTGSPTPAGLIHFSTAKFFALPALNDGETC